MGVLYAYFWSSSFRNKSFFFCLSLMQSFVVQFFFIFQDSVRLVKSS